MTEIRTIVVPLDFSGHSLRALDQAIGLGQRFRSKLHLVHSYAIPMRGVMPYEFAVPDGIWEGIREASEAKLAELREKVVSEGLEVTTEVSPELPTEAIVAAALERDADLIVMGTRGHTGLKHALLGSVAERTIRIAPCPVLTVKDSEGSQSA